MEMVSMALILSAVIWMVVLIVAIAIAMFILLNKDSDKSRYSKYVVNKFEPDNTAPKLSELIEYHKSKDSIKYIIESDSNL